MSKHDDGIEVFRCACCGRDVPWSQGASDGMPEHCDECARHVQGWFEAVFGEGVA